MKRDMLRTSVVIQEETCVPVPVFDGQETLEQDLDKGFRRYE